MSFNSLFGLETEYGITVEDADASALVTASREVVKAYGATGRPFASPWNYRSEDPRNDQRGFHVQRLSVDPVDAQFDRPGERAASPEEDRCDHVLSNGARFYNDHGHPEYSTPECADLRSLVAHDKAGERIVLDGARAYGESIGKQVGIFKNNTDFHGASYGSHESYLLQRRVPWEDVVRNLAPFLATRIIFCGAGKVGCEERGAEANYQLSQRADFFQVLQSVDTLHNRPLVNTRDEPHGNAHRFRRLHVIAGDANLSEYAIALRTGTTNLVAGLIESGWQSPIQLRDPVRAIKLISRDADYRWLVEREGEGTVSAIEVQRAYLEGARNLNLPGSEWILEEWEDILHALETDPLSTYDRLDWSAKKLLLDQFAEAEDLDWERDRLSLQSIDLAYHDVDPEMGLYYGLVESGAMRTLVTEEEIQGAMQCPPPNTRAVLRGILARKFASEIRSISWGGVAARDEHGSFRFALPESGDFASLARQIEDATSLRAVASVLREA
jgi:proteasome accessory factor A